VLERAVNDRIAMKETHAAMTTKNAVYVTGAPVEMKVDEHVKVEV
jgi:hypothetical protein